ncbi:hypothetical protein QL285_045142 [Trifolium repens]|nr:hypothetical protein QL285_045142 [Trifolium repens]
MFAPSVFKRNPNAPSVSHLSLLIPPPQLLSRHPPSIQSFFDQKTSFSSSLQLFLSINRQKNHQKVCSFKRSIFDHIRAISSSSVPDLKAVIVNHRRSQICTRR